MIATVCPTPTSAHNRVARPISRNAPSDASTSNVTQPKNVKFGSTTCSTSHDHGGNTGCSTA